MRVRRTATAKDPRGVQEISTVDTTMKKKAVPDEVLHKLAEHAHIRNFSELPMGLWSEAHKRFVLDIKSAVRRAHMTRAVLRASEIANLKKIAVISRELSEQLKASGKQLQASLVSDDVVNVIDDIARNAERVRRLMETTTPTKWAIMIRKDFVEALLGAAARAGGRLTLSTSQEEESSLVQALDLLNDYLPQELTTKRSFATLRLIYDPWLKKDQIPQAKKRKKTAPQT